MSKGKRTVNNKKRTSLYITYLTPGQQAAHKAMKTNRVTFLTGMAGTAKTYLATAYAMQATIQYHEFKRIVVIRPSVEAGESNGFLPGELSAKLQPFLEPIFDTVRKIAGDDQELLKDVGEVIEKRAIGYLRGLTFDEAICIVDEAQNITLKQMRLILSRLGKNSRMIFCGDTEQSDIDQHSALEQTAMKLSHLDGIAWHQFTDEDNVRDPLINSMLHALEKT